MGADYSAGTYTPPGYVLTEADKKIKALNLRDKGAKYHDINYNDLMVGLEKNLQDPEIPTYEAYRAYHKGMAKADEDFVAFQKNATSDNWLANLQAGGFGIPFFHGKAARHRGKSKAFKNKTDFNTWLQDRGLNLGTKEALKFALVDGTTAPGQISGLDRGSLARRYESPNRTPIPGDHNYVQGGWDNASDTGMGNEPSGMGIGSDTGGGSGAGWGLPVVLDLGRDGITIVPLSQSTARFDLAGRGSRQLVAWPGPDDALLVYDRDGDRLISHRDEIAFAHYLANAKTDLEGLAWFDQLAQGGNADGVLDERDALWSDFGVWRDADQDGETDPGELRMSGDGSISSINLTSDQQPQDAGPDAKVSGKSTYEYLDHNGIIQTADAYDTALKYREEDARHRQRAASLYDHPTSRSGYVSPSLVRRDGRPLSRVEALYPTMCYDDSIHEHCPALKSRHRPNLK